MRYNSVREALDARLKPIEMALDTFPGSLKKEDAEDDWSPEARKAAAEARKSGFSESKSKSYKNMSDWKTGMRAKHGSGITFKQKMHPGGGHGNVEAFHKGEKVSGHFEPGKSGWHPE